MILCFHHKNIFFDCIGAQMLQKLIFPLVLFFPCVALRPFVPAPAKASACERDWETPVAGLFVVGKMKSA